jgi:hypothetical protein
MYSEKENRAGIQRANNEFLRRMLGGELTSGQLPVFNETKPTLPEYPTRPPCGSDPEYTEESANGAHCGHACGGPLNAPSLAMVYAPMQCWKGVFNPGEALKHGSQFSELVLPFEGYRKGRGGCEKC